MSPEQHSRSIRLLTKLQPEELHHGMCIGADEEFHRLCRKYSPSTRIIGHPAKDKGRRANVTCDETRPPKDFLDRNHDVVDEGSDLLVATPRETKEKLRSGTWATIRYARKQGVKIRLLPRVYRKEEES